MPAGRHGAQPVVSWPMRAVIGLVGGGVVAVAALAQVGIALRLATAGALLLAVMVWAAYAEALGNSRRALASERASRTEVQGELATLRRDHELAAAVTIAQVRRLEADLEALRSAAEAGTVERWSELSEAPTVIELAAVRETRAHDGALSRLAQPPRSSGTA